MVPIYIKYLGLEAYGLISFYTSMLIFFQILDFGMYQTLIGEISRSFFQRSKEKIASLIHSLAIINGVIAVTIILFFLLFSSWVASNWIKANSFDINELSNILILIGILIGSRWPILVYQGGLYGIQKIKLACYINIVMVALNSLGSFLILYLFEPKLLNVFLWQIFIGISYTLLIRFFFWNAFGKFKELHFNILEVKRIFTFAFQMAGVTTSAILLTHIDKIILSIMLSLSDFAIYMLAINMSNIFQIIINPIHNILYPKFGELYSKKDFKGLLELYSLSLSGVAALIFPMSLIMFFCSYELTFIYTSDMNLAGIVAPILSILTIGIAFNSVMYIPYTLQLGTGFTKIPLCINIAFFLIIVPLLLFLSKEFGGRGAAFSWLILNSLYLIINPFITHKYILKPYQKKVYILNILPPLILAFLFYLIVNYILIKLDFTFIIKLMLVSFLAFLLFLLNIICSKQLTKYAYKIIKTFIIKD